jgi:formylglycine-generating enzyme required for sulfatase activity
MKKELSHRMLGIKLITFLMLLALVLVCSSPPHSSAWDSQDNRQLQRDSSRPGASERRTALVIGNGAYTNAPPLKNPPNDATLVAATLKKLGFEVSIGTNKSQREMKQLIREFGQRLRAGGGVGLFYFAGHGVQSKGHNYLIPVDADIQNEADLEDVGVDVNYLLNMMDDALSALNIVILDACRNNPFARSFRSAQGGLAQVKAPTGTLIAYATAPDSTAADGDRANSPYTEELTRQMETPGVVLETMFRRVTEQVSTRTGGRQEPWISDNHKGEFYFSKSPANSSPTNSSVSNTPATIDAVAVEREYWETIRSSNDAQDYKDYLKSYPSGAYAVVARAKIRQLEAAKNTQPSNSQPTNTQPSNSASNKPNESAGMSNTGASRPKSFRSQEGIEMVYIPPGKFMMGSNSYDKEQPVHEVTISQAFYMGKYEVTQGQWQAVMSNNPSTFKGDNLPVETVSWDDAAAFIARLNAQNDGFNYRLPTEAEWEYACRAGTTGDDVGDLDAIAWYGNNSGRGRLDAEEIWRTDTANYLKRITENGGQTHAVGSKLPNSFGLFDMKGNVWEWCQDWYHDSYNGAPTDGSAWLSGGEQRALGAARRFMARQQCLFHALRQSRLFFPRSPEQRPRLPCCGGGAASVAFDHVALIAESVDVSVAVRSSAGVLYLYSITLEDLHVIETSRQYFCSLHNMCGG